MKKIPEKAKTGLKFALVLVLLCCLIVQVRDGFIKFIRRQTTLVSNHIQLESDYLPAVSFCPGFRSTMDYYERIEEELNLLDDDETETTPMEAWMKDTYDLNEVIDYIKPPGLDWENLPKIRLSQTGYYKDLNMTVSEINTIFGRCFSFHFFWAIDKDNLFFTFQFNMSNHAELNLYIHERHNEIGLNLGFWPIFPLQRVIKANGDYFFKSQRNMFEPLDNKGCVEDDGYSYPKCVEDWARQTYKTMFDGNNFTGCYAPNTKYYAEGSNFPPCATREESSFARDHAYILITEHLNNPEVTECLRRCKQIQYQLESLGESNVWDGYTLLYFELTLVSDHLQEIYVYDFNTIVASIGGSLGLFLGISCFSVAMYAAKKVGGTLKPCNTP